MSDGRPRLASMTASRDHIEKILRTLRPIPERYFLQEAAMYEDLECCPVLEQIPSIRRPPPGLHISPDPCFVHATVRDWIFDNSLESLTETFLEMGIYQHEDVVHVASGLRLSTEFRQEFQNALNVDNLRWLSVQSVLMRYARPVDYPFVKGSKAMLDHEAKNDYLFDQEIWDRRMQLVDDERITGEQAREAQQSDGAREQSENPNVEQSERASANQ